MINAQISDNFSIGDYVSILFHIDVEVAVLNLMEYRNLHKYNSDQAKYIIIDIRLEDIAV